jgi:hypothetical protein
MGDQLIARRELRDSDCEWRMALWSEPRRKAAPVFRANDPEREKHLAAGDGERAWTPLFAF